MRKKITDQAISMSNLKLTLSFLKRNLVLDDLEIDTLKNECLRLRHENEKLEKERIKLQKQVKVFLL